MKGHDALTSSVSQNWATPPDLYLTLHNEFVFTLDACADESNHKCDKYFTEAQDGLKQEWQGYTAFINPPYNETKLWVEKAIEQHHKYGITIVMLLASRTGNKTWHELIVPHAKQIRFLKGRIKFVGATSGATFDSAIVVFSTKSTDKAFEKFVFIDYR
jgi:site-specific DNA-methyltransferase (adenine-specific)